MRPRSGSADVCSTYGRFRGRLDPARVLRMYVAARLATIGTSSATTATCASMGSSHLALIGNLGGGDISLILATEGAYSHEMDALSLSRLCIASIVASMWPGPVTATRPYRQSLRRARKRSRPPARRRQRVRRLRRVGTARAAGRRAGHDVPLQIGFGARSIRAAAWAGTCRCRTFSATFHSPADARLLAPTDAPGARTRSPVAPGSNTPHGPQGIGVDQETPRFEIVLREQKRRVISSIEKGPALSSLRHRRSPDGPVALETLTGPGGTTCSSSTRSPLRLSPAAAAWPSTSFASVQHAPDTGLRQARGRLVYGTAGRHRSRFRCSATACLAASAR